MIVVSKTPMQIHIGGGTSELFLDFNKALSKFFQICEALEYEYKEEIQDDYPYFHAGGVGNDYRVELKVLIKPINQ
jgi:hypothetical protein